MKSGSDRRLCDAHRGAHDFEIAAPGDRDRRMHLARRAKC